MQASSHPRVLTTCEDVLPKSLHDWVNIGEPVASYAVDVVPSLSEEFSYFPSSISKDLRRISIKYEARDANPAFRGHEVRISARSHYPKDILPLQIGSNEDLPKVLHEILVEHVRMEKGDNFQTLRTFVPKHVLVVVADVDIFARILKVPFSS